MSCEEQSGDVCVCAGGAVKNSLVMCECVQVEL